MQTPHECRVPQDRFVSETHVVPHHEAGRGLQLPGTNGREIDPDSEAIHDSGQLPIQACFDPGLPPLGSSFNDEKEVGVVMRSLTAFPYLDPTLTSPIATQEHQRPIVLRSYVPLNGPSHFTNEGSEGLFYLSPSPGGEPTRVAHDPAEGVSDSKRLRRASTCRWGRNLSFHRS